MSDADLLAAQFEDHRARLRAVAYRMLGTVSDADDAVQEAWLRLHRADQEGIANLPGWLTSVVARVCVDMLRARSARREHYAGSWLPEPLVQGDELAGDPEYEMLLADSVGLALLVVLDTLAPDERLAFVLHDMFAVAFDEIAAVLATTPAAARQLASRARRRVRGATPPPETDAAQQRHLVDAFVAASRGGDFAARGAVRDPQVVLRLDAGGKGDRVREPVSGAEVVARRVLARGRPFANLARPATVNGSAGLIVASHGVPIAVVGFTFAGALISAIDLIADRDKLRHLDVAAGDQGHA
jgi:RNA polymerase sigma-70 factor (ECF subfamily)